MAHEGFPPRECDTAGQSPPFGECAPPLPVAWSPSRAAVGEGEAASASPPRVTHTEFPSPLGVLGLIAVDGVLARVCLDDSMTARALAEVLHHTGGIHVPADAALGEIESALAGYFAGERPSLALPVILLTRGAFHHRVYAWAATIRPGQTASFGAAARALSRPTAVRAVGVACAQNPAPIAIPTHRIVGARGQPAGTGSADYAARCWLLHHERATLV